MIRWIVGSFIAAIVLFFWGFTFWAATPVADQFIHPLPNADEVVEALKKSDPPTGEYIIPLPPGGMHSTDEKENAAVAAKSKAGPIVTILYSKEGTEPAGMDFVRMGLGFVHYFISTLLIGGLLLMARDALPSYLSRVTFATMVGIFAAVALNLGKPIWFHTPWLPALYTSIYDVVCWLLAGLILAAFIRPTAVGHSASLKA
jgi:hypothetical protein